MSLGDELARVADAAEAYAAAGERLTGIVAAEAIGGVRVYLCSYESAEARSWLALDAADEPTTSRALVREAASIAAMCEVAEETAGGGHLEELRGQLVALRLTDAPAGIEEAEEAALALEQAIRPAPRVASSAYLDALGDATRRLELALGEPGPSPFGEAMLQAVGAVEELAAEIEAHSKLELR